MLLLRFDATEKSVHNRSGPQQLGDTGQTRCSTGAAVVRAGRRGVGPGDRGQPPASIRKHQQELVHALPVHPPQDREAPAFERMSVTDDGDEIGKVFGVGSVSGVPLTGSITTS